MTRLASALALTLALVVASLEAQPTTISVLNKSQRQGTFTSASVTVPAGLTRVTGAININANDMEDPATDIKLRIFVSGDNGATWQFITGGSWVGGPCTSKNGEPCTWEQNVNEVEQYVGMLARAELDVLNRVSVGLNLVF